jgi:hypothetical protein
MNNTKPLSVSEIRAVARKHAVMLAALLDTLPCSYVDALAEGGRSRLRHYRGYARSVAPCLVERLPSGHSA